MQNRKKLFPLVVLTFVIVLQLVCFSSALAIDATIGRVGINDYQTYCGYGDRAGVNYCNNLSNYVKYIYQSLGGNASDAFIYTNNNATKTALSSTNSNAATLFIYSGHGHHRLSSNYNTFHLAYYNGYSHSSLTNQHDNLNVNFTTLNASFPHKYVVAYTCNWLTNGGSSTLGTNILNTLNGTRLMMGFASQMYLDSREGSLFGLYMETYNIRNAYLYAASYYQPQNSNDVIARIVGYNSASNDYIYNSSASAPSYSSSPSSFSILNTLTIPHN